VAYSVCIVEEEDNELTVPGTVLTCGDNELTFSFVIFRTQSLEKVEAAILQQNYNTTGLISTQRHHPCCEQGLLTSLCFLNRIRILSQREGISSTHRTHMMTGGVLGSEAGATHL
jgi:hypothetical protein